jgi:hypothetical protein
MTEQGKEERGKAGRDVGWRNRESKPAPAGPTRDFELRCWGQGHTNGGGEARAWRGMTWQSRVFRLARGGQLETSSSDVGIRGPPWR